VIIQKFKLNYDVNKLREELDELWPLEDYELFNSKPTPNGSYTQNGKLPPHIKTIIENSIGKRVKDNFFLWDFRCKTTELGLHRDEWLPEKVINVDVNADAVTAVVALENSFRLDVISNDTNDFESLTYGPGEIVCFNNIKDVHGGVVIGERSTPRRTLNCFIEPVPWPVIKTKIEEGQKVPLQENYEFNDMWYLDTPQAYPIFEAQADIIIKKQCKGIVDVGCRHGPIIDILHKKGYTDFNYMGFDTSEEPIAIAEEKWKDHDNIEFRCESWNDLSSLIVDFDVDQVIWSGVLLYRPNDHFEFFNKVVCDIYNSPNAIIQEPMAEQKHWEHGLILNRISDEFDKYKEKYTEFKETELDCEIFAGRRVVVDVTI
jgi:2-polyprenyl-3-methyl-5-hydroxy-6-metoxy-1,4-benzoquinol methylase